MEEIKAIETYYNGYKFRSRLEARWAVFFDAACISYWYEPEGFTLPDGTCYLPDFYLPDENMYVEVKPPRRSAMFDIKKASKFIGHEIETLLILPNIPDQSACIWYFPVLYWNSVEQRVLVKWCPFRPNPLGYNSIILERGFIDPRGSGFRLLHDIEMIKDEYQEVYTKNFLAAYKDESEFPFDWTLEEGSEERLLMTNAWDKARQARFEYGEKG